MLSVKQGNCEYQFLSHWFDPTWNEIQVYSSRGGRSYHSTTYKIIHALKQKNRQNRLKFSRNYTSRKKTLYHGQQHDKTKITAEITS